MPALGSPRVRVYNLLIVSTCDSVAMLHAHSMHLLSWTTFVQFKHRYIIILPQIMGASLAKNKRDATHHHKLEPEKKSELLFFCAPHATLVESRAPPTRDTAAELMARSKSGPLVGTHRRVGELGERRNKLQTKRRRRRKKNHHHQAAAWVHGLPLGEASQ